MDDDGMMANGDAEALATRLFQVLLHRSPGAVEKTAMSDLIRARGFEAAFSRITESSEFRKHDRATCAWPAGHFYSPVVDPETVRDYVARERKSRPEDIRGVALDLEKMEGIWRDNASFIADTPFHEQRVAGLRYFWSDGPYPIGDATTYRMMINLHRPSRIIEIGSGQSTVCALDTLDEIGSSETAITCIEPFPEALMRRLFPGDSERIKILASPVQEVNPALFEDLNAHDILFIDSTHVLKTGSDVHFEFFEILPRLKPGVLIHFHDVRWPFEYPDPFIFERNFSWNEAYALRALLSFSSRYSVVFWNSLFATFRTHLVDETFRSFRVNAGSSIWLRVEG